VKKDTSDPKRTGPEYSVMKREKQYIFTANKDTENICIQRLVIPISVFELTPWDNAGFVHIKIMKSTMDYIFKSVHGLIHHGFTSHQEQLHEGQDIQNPCETRSEVWK